ncbi:serine--tRNA ligase [Ktedonobacteria bacterium brp13]|nr:serine--tRNA ligase [Ktedonobacteria bacterium brp13]
MLNLDFVCQHPQIVREALRKRHDARTIDDILQLASQRRAYATECDGFYVELKALKGQISAVPIAERDLFNVRVKVMSEEIRRCELQIADRDSRLHFLLLNLPNIPHSSVPFGAANDPDEEIHRWGERATFYFDPQAHWDVGTHLGMLDIERGSRIAGSRFVLLKGMGARLERALITFMLDVHTRQHDYTEILPPQLVNRAAMFSAGQFPKFEDQVYQCTDELYLNPTAEVPLVGMHAGDIFAEGELPLRYVSWTTAYRREAGSSSRQTRGLLRLHQFNKVELFQYVAPSESYGALSQMLQHAETILQQLELSYRVVALNSAHLPFSAAKTFDIEVWMPAQHEYVEVSSVSNCEAFQAQRACIKYRAGKHAHAHYVHTLNGSGLAVGRTMAAILETYQQADGSVVVPKVLRPYMQTSLLVPSDNA